MYELLLVFGTLALTFSIIIILHFTGLVPLLPPSVIGANVRKISFSDSMSNRQHLIDPRPENRVILDRLISGEDKILIISGEYEFHDEFVHNALKNNLHLEIITPNNLNAEYKKRIKGYLELYGNKFTIWIREERPFFQRTKIGNHLILEGFHDYKEPYGIELDIGKPSESLTMNFIKLFNKERSLSKKLELKDLEEISDD